MTAFKRAAVLYGGRSVEREVSLVSGRACSRALAEEGFEVIDIDAGRGAPNYPIGGNAAGHDLAQRLIAAKPDAAFNALHGRWGEDGCVQGLLELMEIPYTHSGVLASALAMHKEHAKVAFRAAGLPVAEGFVADRVEASKRHLLKPPYVVKPVNQGSSVGVFIIREGDNHPPGALGSAEWTLGDEIMVEEFIPGRELTVAVMGTKENGNGMGGLAVTEILPKTQFYDYDAKYAAGGSDHVVPARIPEKVTREAIALAERAHSALGCRGVSRTDFRYDDAKDRLIVLEVNTQPGMTPTSLVPEQAAHRGMSFNALVRWMLEDASCDR
ncbi:MAG: D-alanine--D-alanine ligase [Candidatus Krumholzibacteriota bacterium]|nr:D-alanine--D-alanine ligase [Candidatus Krumholzibacteriota bacterium]